MEKLNLPPFDYRLREEEDITYIFDILRKKFLVLTPEEWVRQHLVHLMIDQFHYPKTLMKLESGHEYNQLKKRTDVVVYDRNAQPFLLVECKAPNVELSQKTFEQVCAYNQTLRAPYICISNGKKTLCCSVNFATNETTYLTSLPKYI